MENKHKFKPFDKVWVRDHEEVWQPDLYGFWDKGRDRHQTMINYGIADSDILPYEGNEHLIGTTDDPDEEIAIENGEYCFGAYRDDCTKLVNWQLFQFDCIDSDCQFKERFGKGRYFDLAFRFSDFNPDMDELRKHILCVKNGRIVRFKE